MEASGTARSAKAYEQVAKLHDHDSDSVIKRHQRYIGRTAASTVQYRTLHSHEQAWMYIRTCGSTRQSKVAEVTAVGE